MLEQLEGVGARLQVGPLRLEPPLGLGPQLGSAQGLGPRLGFAHGLGPRLGPPLRLGPRGRLVHHPLGSPAHLTWTRLQLRVGEGLQGKRAAPHRPLQL